MKLATTAQLALPAVRLVAVVVVVVVLTVLVVRAFAVPVPAQDEGILLVYPQRVLAGDVPNRDFEHLYGPANLWVLAAVYSFTPDTVVTERIVGLAYRAAAVLAVFLLARRFGDGAAFGAALVCSLCLIARGMGAYAFSAGIALLAWSGYVSLLAAEAAGDGPGGRRLRLLRIGAGLLAGLAVMFRTDLAPAAVAVVAAGLVSQNKRDATLSYVAGMALGLAPAVVHIAMAGIDATYDGMIQYPFLELPEGRRLPLPPADDRVRTVLALSGVSVALLLARAATDLARRRFDARSQAALTASVLMLGLAPQALQRADLGHSLWLACVAVAFVPVGAVIAVDAVRWSSETAGRIARVGALVIATGLIVIFLRPIVDGALNPSDEVEHAGRRVPIERFGGAPDLELILDAAESATEPGDRLVVAPAELRRANYNDTFIYFLLPELQPGTYYLEMNPWSANGPDSRLADELGSADVVILSDRHDFFFEANRSSVFGPDAAFRALRAQFCSVARHGHWELLQRCHPAP